VAEYKKPLPLPNSDTKEFWDGAKRHELLLQKCSQCGNYRYPPSPICPNCFSQDFKWEKASGKGEIYTYTVVRVPLSLEWEPYVPYVLATIKLDEGVRMVATVVDCKPEDVKIGMQVKVVFNDATERFTIPEFKPVG
jgi:hypothetical protein